MQTLKKFLISALPLCVLSVIYLFAQQQNVAPFTQPFATYSTLPTTGCPTVANNTYAHQTSGTVGLFYSSSTSGTCSWTAVGGGSSGAYAASQPATGNISQTGSFVDLYSQASVPALASGSCYAWAYQLYSVSAGTATAQIAINGTVVAPILSPTSGGTGYYYQQQGTLCNSSGTLTVTITVNQYCGATLGCPSQPWTNNTPSISGNFPTTTNSPSVVSPFTFKIQTNAASGNMQGISFRIGS